MSNTLKRRMIKGTALTIDIVPPFIATLAQFPIWVDKSADATVSGLFIVLAFFSCLPFIKQIKAFMRSPSIPILWMVLFVMLSALSNIIDQMVIVCFVGMISNIIGTLLYKLGDRYNREEE